MALTAKIREQVLWLHPFCVYCGDVATQVDHITPRSRGGADDLENLTGACRGCNMEKLDFTPDEWRQWRESEGLCWPPQSQAEAALAMLRERYGPDGIEAAVGRLVKLIRDER